MPKKRYSADEVIALYTELGVVNEVARQLGANKDTIRKILRRHQGMCKSCVNAILPGHVLCDECLEKQRTRRRAHREKRKREGVCIQCDQPREPPSRLYCAQHRLEHLDRNVAYNERQRQKRGTSHPGKQSDGAHRRYLRYKYGLDGIAAWERDNGKCAACNATRDDVSIVIHHIDGNHDNSVLENMVCLCFRCHKLTHLLIEHPVPMTMLKWLRSTYPDAIDFWTAEATT
jgi:5-methylcytosine-specific restriction endonuclease McrA